MPPARSPAALAPHAQHQNPKEARKRCRRDSTSAVRPRGARLVSRGPPVGSSAHTGTTGMVGKPQPRSDARCRVAAAAASEYDWVATGSRTASNARSDSRRDPPPRWRPRRCIFVAPDVVGAWCGGKEGARYPRI